MSLLLVGASGRIGRMLVRHWAAEPPLVPLVTAARRAGADLLWAPLEGPLPPEAGRISCMIVLAGMVPGAGDLSQNAAIARACLRAAEAAGVRRVLLASSAAVYGPGADLSEADRCAPVTPYGGAKLEMEAVAAEARVETCCLRIGNVAGADALLGNAGRASVRLDRFADGAGPRRSYIGPATLAWVLERLAAYPGALPLVLNVAAARPVAMAALLRAAGTDWSWGPAPKDAVQEVTLDCGRLAALVDLPEAAAEPEILIAQWRKLMDPI